MRHLAVKLSEKLHQLEQQNGPFKVKCLIRRTPEDTQWDLILWADWFDVNERPRVSHLMDALIRPLQDDDLLYFNAMITFGPKDNSPFLQELAKIQRHYDTGAYYPAWHDGLVEIPLHLASSSLVVPLGHPLIATNAASVDRLPEVAAAR